MCDSGYVRHVASCLGLLLLLHGAGGKPSVWGDVFELSGGGRLEGEWLNGDEPGAAQYVMRTAQGMRVVLDRGDVLAARREVSAEELYRETAAHYPDDVAGNWALAEWCRQQGLTARRERHLRRVLELDSNHAQARVALGYSQVDGRWLTREEAMRERGYVLYRGKWCLSQQVELMEVQRRQRVAEIQWLRQLARWRHDLSTERCGAATASILAIQDPNAVPGLATMLQQETTRPPKVLWIRTLAQIKSPRALDVLINVVLTEADLEIVHGCLDVLVEVGDPQVQRKFLELLRDESNVAVNRAALALGRLEQPSAIDSLIDALVTNHTIRVGGPPSKAPVRAIPTRLKNPEVLTALTHLSKTPGYGYDQHAWKQWRYHQNRQAFAKEAATADMRRGE